MTKRGVIRCVFSVLLLAYLVVALSFTSYMAGTEPYSRFVINVEGDTQSGFVNAEDIDQELGGLSKCITQMRPDSVNTLKIERLLLNMDNIEAANCVILNDGSIRLDVLPLQPVARVFDSYAGTNYYINRQGKRMRASTRYRVDVPIISGYFDGTVTPTDALPVIDYINRHPAWSKMVSSMKVTRHGDVIIVPMVKGHVINFGDSSDLQNKFDRLNVFYRKVLPVKGWEYYDTISVKWRRQVVAKKREAYRPVVEDLPEDEDFIDDAGTMLDDVPQP